MTQLLDPFVNPRLPVTRSGPVCINVVSPWLEYMELSRDTTSAYTTPLIHLNTGATPSAAPHTRQLKRRPSQHAVILDNNSAQFVTTGYRLDLCCTTLSSLRLTCMGSGVVFGARLRVWHCVHCTAVLRNGQFSAEKSDWSVPQKQSKRAPSTPVIPLDRWYLRLSDSVWRYSFSLLSSYSQPAAYAELATGYGADCTAANRRATRLIACAQRAMGRAKWVMGLRQEQLYSVRGCTGHRISTGWAVCASLTSVVMNVKCWRAIQRMQVWVGGVVCALVW